MKSEGELRDLILQMRRTGSDSQVCEVKEAVGGLPKKLVDSISAFSNMHGGTIILGLSERKGFVPAADFDADRIYSQMQILGDAMTPRVHMEIERMPFEGGMLVVAHVPALPPNQKPCYVTDRGQYGGSYVRSGDGDRRLSAYEVDRLLEARMQPQFDIEPVEAASMEDLSRETLQGIVRRARDLFPRNFAKLSDEAILQQLGVALRVGEKLCPTVAGLLVAGIFPQRFFPRLQVVLTAYPGTTKAGDRDTGRRYTDSKELIGSIPEMLLDTLDWVRRHTNTGAVLEGGLRKDIPDYPVDAVREAVANALQHRDYSPEGRGTHVEVNLYADRLEISNPGGLYGVVTVESLGKEGLSASRNAFLSRLLTYTPYEDGFVVENKGTGFMTIQAALAKALMPEPKIGNSLTFFRLTLEKRRKTPEERDERSWERLDEAILAEVKTCGSLSIKELITMSGFSRATVTNHVRRLVEEGWLEPTEMRKSPKQRYRLTRRNFEKNSASLLDSTGLELGTVLQKVED